MMVRDGDGGGGGGGGMHLAVAWYIGRGVDQSTRALKVVEHLLAAGHDLYLVTSEPDFLRNIEIESSRLHIREVEQVVLECGAPNALTVDSFASLELYHAALVPREAMLREEAKWIKSIKADFVIAGTWAEDMNENAELSPRPLAGSITKLKSLSGLVVDGVKSPENLREKNSSYLKSPQVDKTPSPPLKRQRGRSLPPSPNTSQLVLAARRRSNSSSPSPRHRSEIKSSSPCCSGDENGEMKSMDPDSPGHKTFNDEPMTTTNPGVSSMSVFWDIQNCEVPNDTQAEKVCENIREALRLHFAIDCVTIQAYGAPKKIGKHLESTGVILVDITKKKKDAADKLILVDMLLAPYARPTPSIMLISGDGDFTRAVEGLVHQGHFVAIAIPSVDTSAISLLNAGSYILDWPSLARGDIVIPDIIPEDISVIKANMIHLFESNGGYIDLARILPEYSKAFGKKIRLASYGVAKVFDLFVMMGSPFYAMEGGLVFLTTSKLPFEEGSSSTTIISEVLANDSFVEEDKCGPIEDEFVEQIITVPSNLKETGEGVRGCPMKK